jgi:sodium transport system permease protein
VKPGGALSTLYKAEMRMLLRERRTLLATIVLPLAVMPAMLLSSHWVESRRETRSKGAVHLYAVDASVVEARTWIEATRARLDAPGSRGNPAILKVREVETVDGIRSLEKGDVHFFLRQEAFGTRPPAGRAGGGGADEAAAPGVPHLVVVYRADRAASLLGGTAFREALAATRRDHRQLLLGERGFSLKSAQLVQVAETDVSTEGEAAGMLLGRGLTAVLLFFVLSAGAVVATDSLAGEKERGTLETLLTTAASRTEIVAAKHFVILTVALLVTLFQAASLLLCVGFRIVPLPAGLAAAVPPSVAGLVLLLALPVAALSAAALLLVSGFAASYREAQLAFVPLLLAGLVPALVPFLPGLPLRSAILLVPVSNVAVAVKELLAGSRDWLSMGIAWLVTAAAALLVSWAAVRSLSLERLVLPAARSSRFSRPSRRRPTA